MAILQLESKKILVIGASLEKEMWGPCPEEGPGGSRSSPAPTQVTSLAANDPKWCNVDVQSEKQGLCKAVWTLPGGLIPVPMHDSQNGTRVCPFCRADVRSLRDLLPGHQLFVQILVF